MQCPSRILVPIYQSTLHNFPTRLFILMRNLLKLLVNQMCYCCSLLMFWASRTQLCICYLDIQSRDVKYCQVNQLGNCAMYVAQSRCGWSSMWLFFVATTHVGAWRRKIKHSSWTTAFLLHSAGPDQESIYMLLQVKQSRYRPGVAVRVPGS